MRQKRYPAVGRTFEPLILIPALLLLSAYCLSLKKMGEQAQIFELSNGFLHMKLSNWGATIISLLVPDRNGELEDVVLGFDTLDPYLEGASPYFGCIVGRVANRIANGKFSLDGKEHSLPINNPPNSLHGGTTGFDKVAWEVVEKKTGDCPSITFKYYSRDGEQGYPGGLIATATYTITGKTTLQLDMEATPENKATPVSLAQHTYWNLAGHNSGDILNHNIQIWSNHITPVNENTIPTGEIMSLEGSPFDLRKETKVGATIGQVPGGYDHNYVLDCGEERSGLKHAARLKDPSSGRLLDLWTSAPGMQFYTGNYVNSVVGKSGATYDKHAGLCLETQGFPDAINQPNFPSVVVRPGEKYSHTMVFEFSIDEN